ncbi:hypothetical protein CBY09_07050 [Acidovorax kalamii]|uniref:Winged helix-turn-helix domain-containing protein n=2 Tax=Acidovorax kalamii TaxID=2004485 RepID=A0A235ERB4_9BURK|nr:hypothetical protein CBY09_07050 [Acidovorax kalamii]
MDQPTHRQCVRGHTMHTDAIKRQALAEILAAHPGTDTMAQCTRIRAALVRFALSTFEASRYLDCYDPRARVMQLRHAGDVIRTHWQTVETEGGGKHRVGLYVLEPKGGSNA